MVRTAHIFMDYSGSGDGRDYITPPKAVYTWYIRGIYCQLGN